VIPWLREQAVLLGRLPCACAKGAQGEQPSERGQHRRARERANAVGSGTSAGQPRSCALKKSVMKQDTTPGRRRSGTPGGPAYRCTRIPTGSATCNRGWSQVLHQSLEPRAMLSGGKTTGRRMLTRHTAPLPLLLCASLSSPLTSPTPSLLHSLTPTLLPLTLSHRRGSSSEASASPPS